MKNIICAFALLFVCSAAIAQQRVSGGTEKPVEVVAPSWFKLISKDSLSQFVNDFIRLSGRNYTQWHSDTSRLSETTREIKIRFTDLEKKSLDFLFFERTVGADASLEISGTKVFEFRSVFAPFKDVFEWWKYSVEPSADITLTSKQSSLKRVLENQHTSSITQVYLKLQEQGDGYWKMSKN